MRGSSGQTSASYDRSVGDGLFVPKPGSVAVVLGRPTADLLTLSADVRPCVWIGAAIVTPVGHSHP
jgi:hypothetical protein